jgi:hypothetical protein
MKGINFVHPRSIVRKIWGNSDTILLIFAGASAEFALNKAVDWLYFTGRLPVDPLGRLFTTVAYARVIVFSDEQAALRAIDSLRAIHSGVEAKRGALIPGEAYRDVLFMLIDYSIRAYEVLQGRVGGKEKQEVFDVFYRVGNRMGLAQLPESYDHWKKMRREHMGRNLVHSHYSRDLFTQYRKHLGSVRYALLVEAQRLVVPGKVAELLGFGRCSLLYPLIGFYKAGRKLKLDKLLKAIILPPDYKKKILALDVPKL